MDDTVSNYLFEFLAEAQKATAIAIPILIPKVTLFNATPILAPIATPIAIPKSTGFFNLLELFHLFIVIPLPANNLMTGNRLSFLR